MPRTSNSVNLTFLMILASPFEGVSNHIVDTVPESALGFSCQELDSCSGLRCGSDQIASRYVLLVDIVISLIARTNSGPVEGFIDTHPVSDFSPIKKWLGIPCAQVQRWQRAQAPTSWTEPLQCFEFEPSFPQPISSFDEMYAGKKGWFTRDFLGQSEDAFSLNVFAPVIEGRSKIPVMMLTSYSKVWVYGGNLSTGSSNMPIYDPSEFARAQASSETPCIVVTGNYRLNAFGWLATDDLAEVNGHIGNFGLHDVISIFEWVQANIMEFGGDPDNVDPELALVSAVDRINRLKTIPTAELLDAAQAFYRTSLWCLTYDSNEPGWATPVWDLVNKGDYDPWIESIIIGVNRDEGTFFNHHSQFWIRENAVKMIKDRRALMMKHHAAPDLSDLRTLSSTMIYSDSGYLMPMLHAGDKFTAVPNSRTGKPARVYMYLCRTLPSRLLEGNEHFGVLHTGEIPFIFKRSSLWEDLDDGKDAQTSDTLGKFWSSFSTSGNPGSEWPMFTEGGGEILIISDGGKVSVGNAWEIRPTERQAWMDATEKSIASPKETLVDSIRPGLELVVFKPLQLWDISGFLTHAASVAEYYRRKRDIFETYLGKYLIGVAQ
ncbi:Alpha/Beta hydrolase protein [Desarmillaria ectypa]|nr:Alpha/Beta hydrolase protein [Desarmillaria ectypa]